MKMYLFRFGYMTPEQIISNDENEWDDEGSFAFFVVADSKSGAEKAGVEIADAFFEYNFGEKYSLPISRWSSGQFAYWIDENPEASFSMEQISSLPVAENEPLDFSKWPKL